MERKKLEVFPYEKNEVAWLKLCMQFKHSILQTHNPGLRFFQIYLQIAGQICVNTQTFCMTEAAVFVTKSKSSRIITWV